jgi:hypothetical protein
MSENPYAAPKAKVASAAASGPMENNIKTWRAHRAFSWLYGCIAVVMFVVMLKGDQPPAAAFAALLVLGAIFALHFFVARGAKARKNWARRVSLIIGFLMLPGFPLGSLIGAYLIAASWTEWREPRTYSGSLTDGWPSATPSDS